MDENFAWQFLAAGLKCNFSSRMIGNEIMGVKVTRGIWDKITEAMVEVGLLRKERGAQTLVLFGPPLYPILYGVPHPWRNWRDWTLLRSTMRNLKPSEWTRIPMKGDLDAPESAGSSRPPPSPPSGD